MMASRWIALLLHCAREFEASYLRTRTKCCIGSCLFVSDEFPPNSRLRFPGEDTMIYTNPIIECLRFVEEVHHGQYDKLGVPYLLHPVAVAEQMTTENEILVALLHDVVEDTSVTLDDLRDRGYSDEVVAAVDILTRRSGEPYSTYIERVSTNELARRIKLADLQHNLQPDRVKLLGNDTLVKRYEKALRQLSSVGMQ